MLLKQILRELSSTRQDWINLLPVDGSADAESTTMISKLPLKEPYRYGLSRMYTPRARYDYAVDDNLVQILNALYKLVCSYHPVSCSTQNMVDVQTYFNTSMIYNSYAFVYVSVLSSLDEVNTEKSEAEQWYIENNREYESIDTGDNAYVFIPKDLFFTDDGGNLRYNSIQIIMHRNSDRNAHINDGMIAVCNRLLNLINTSAYSIHQFTTDELKDWDNLELEEYDELYHTAIEMFGAEQQKLVDAKEAIRLQRVEYVKAKAASLISELIKPVIKEGKAVPLRNTSDIADEIRSQIVDCTNKIKSYQAYINEQYYAIEKYNLELMAVLQGADNLRGDLVEALNRIASQPNSFLRHYTVTEKGDVVLAFIAPTVYWEDDEISQWDRTDYKNEVRLITSKRFQMWTRCVVTIRHDSGVQGSDLDIYNTENVFYDILHDDSLLCDTAKLDELMQNTIDRQSLSIRRGLACEQYYRHTIPHQHIARFSCFGNNADLIHKALRDGNYDLALNVIIHCVTQLNLTDSCVVERTARTIRDNRGVEFFYDTQTNEWITPRDAIQIMKETA